MPRYVLWTGGWDSTFRLLDLVLVRECQVQPYYLVDAERPSTEAELRAMTEIRRQLDKINPDAGRRLLPLKSAEVVSIEPDANITKAYLDLRRQGPLGSQYEWLAAFADKNDLRDLELSIDKGSRPHIILADALKPFVDEGGRSYRLVNTPSDPSLNLFRRFAFPLLEMSKVDMDRYAQVNSFRSLLDLTWFCHTPRDGRPCGTCSPCYQVMQAGLAERIPLRGRSMYYISRVYRGAKKIARRFVRRSAESQSRA